MIQMECLDLLYLRFLVGKREGGMTVLENGLLSFPSYLGCYFFIWLRTFSCPNLGLNIYPVPAGGATVGVFSSNREFW